MVHTEKCPTLKAVALLAEGVGRNCCVILALLCAARASPSSRRAWVEIGLQPPVLRVQNGRPPRGGRG